MSRKKISTTIYVTPEQDERLRLLHQRTKVPVAVYIREGIDLVLRQYGHLLPGQLPLASDSAVPQPPLEGKLTPQRPERGDRAGGSESSVERAASAGATKA
jgi:hypothetical protein